MASLSLPEAKGSKRLQQEEQDTGCGSRQMSERLSSLLKATSLVLQSTQPLCSCLFLTFSRDLIF